MTRSSHLFLTAALAVSLAVAPSRAAAQAVVQPLPGTTDADRLADTMRELASNPRNVDALIRAGELSMGLGDLSGAAALFARAEKIDPRSGRMKAGMASILVRSERPGEALRYFSQAEGYGLPSRYFAADRGLAYDLIGQQDRAQRDYREALRTAPDDETVRRYALSLGISGRQDLALKQLEPLIARTDRGAWRARAFILAMTSDVPGAEHIATTMMPAGMAQGLLPFFRRLPALAPADRAFAVHFGEVSATPERIADARMVPPLPVLGPDPTAPVMMAAVQQPVAATIEKKAKRDRRVQPGRVALAAAPTGGAPTVTAPVVLAAAQPIRIAAVRTVPATVSVPVPAARVPVAVASPSPAPVVVAQVPSQPAIPQPVTLAAVPTASGVTPTAVPRTVTTAAPIRSIAPTGSGQLPAGVATQMAALPAAPGSGAIVSRAGSTTLEASKTVSSTAPAVAAPIGTAAPAPGFSTTPTSPATSAVPVEVAVAAPPPHRAVAASEDSILARIVASLSIPASELGVGPVAQPAAIVAASTHAPTPGAGAPEDGARVIAEAKAKIERDAAARRIAADRLAADKKLAAEKLAVDKKAADRRAAADRKALAEKKAAAEKKAIADKEAAEAKRIERANPSRIWVQVAGGATEGDLPKAYKAVKARAPDVFGTRGAWTTPLRATNRVLSGPFKTDAEARIFVNQLAKAGVSAFSFTSDSGQVVTKLPPK